MIAHLAGRKPDVAVRGEAAQPDPDLSPALYRAVVEDRARRVVARSDRHSRTPGAEVDRRQVVAHVRGRTAAIARVAVPELTKRIVAPALDLMVVE